MPDSDLLGKYLNSLRLSEPVKDGVGGVGPRSSQRKNHPRRKQRRTAAGCGGGREGAR